MSWIKVAMTTLSDLSELLESETHVDMEKLLSLALTGGVPERLPELAPGFLALLLGGRELAPEVRDDLQRALEDVRLAPLGLAALRAEQHRLRG